MRLLSQFSYSYEHIGAILRMFSQPSVCDMMLLFEKEKELSAGKIRKNIDGAQDFVISKSLSLLKSHKKIDKVGKTYKLRNDLLFRQLQEATKKIKAMTDRKNVEDISGSDIRSVAALFSDVFFDNTCNIMLHILLDKGRNIHEIEGIFRQNHGYLPRGKTRYYLAIKKFSACGKPVEVFEIVEGRYAVTSKGKRAHEIFDKLIDGYQASVEERIKRVWNVPVGELVGDRSPIVYLRDPLHKVLRALDESEALIAFSSEPEGIIPIKNTMNIIAENHGKRGFLEEVAAKDVMIPISGDQILKKDVTLSDVLKSNNNKLPFTYYIVNTGGNTFGLLNLHNLIKKFNEG